ncbi:MAG: sigma-54-dependent Fis family transcriptional regulator [Pirellulales bacterium]|nr:sigma-54-dependent Fis family transcriptional regulator [Pirellulales bacterium]
MGSTEGGTDSFSLDSQLQLVAPRSATVLIEGETGVGKEVTARRIHAISPRANKPFVPVDCTVFSTELMESQLFGHVKGAFTGAVGAALGFVRCADGGTLFLDEIGELPLYVQAKLLRCIQERSVVPVGGVEPIAVDLRIVAATHRDLASMVRAGTFRQDLYFRLNVVRLRIEPLRCRRDEIVPLAQQFAEEFSAAYQEMPKRISSAAEAALVRYDWPGNVRELRNAIERAVLYCGERTIEIVHLPNEVREAGKETASAATCAKTMSQREAAFPRLLDAERELIARALQHTRGNQTDAARLLDVERHRLRRKIVQHGLEHLARFRPR